MNCVKIQWIEFKNLKTNLEIERIYFNEDVLRGLTEEEIRLCIRVFDKICNNAEEQLKNYKENES